MRPPVLVGLSGHDDPATRGFARAWSAGLTAFDDEPARVPARSAPKRMPVPLPDESRDRDCAKPVWKDMSTCPNQRAAAFLASRRCGYRPYALELAAGQGPCMSPDRYSGRPFVSIAERYLSTTLRHQGVRRTVTLSASPYCGGGRRSGRGRTVGFRAGGRGVHGWAGPPQQRAAGAAVSVGSHASRPARGGDPGGGGGGAARRFLPHRRVRTNPPRHTDR
ncbi:MAG: hypothetical protein QOE03_2161 [Micromonosporaceae bacterium]|nr:hypothetical protein [Micromonosporaceae bacterium]